MKFPFNGNWDMDDKFDIDTVWETENFNLENASKIFQTEKLHLILQKNFGCNENLKNV